MLRPATHTAPCGTWCFSGRDEITVLEMYSLTWGACVRWPIHLSGCQWGALKGMKWQSRTSTVVMEMSDETSMWGWGCAVEQSMLKHTKKKVKTGAFNIQDSCFLRLDFCLRVCVCMPGCVSLFKQHCNHRLLSTVVSRITAFIPNPTLRTHSHDGLDIIKASQPQRGHRNRKPNTTGED